MRIYDATLRKFRSVWLAAAGALLLLPSAAAQVPGAPGQEKAEPLSKVERKNRAPVSKEVLRVKLPRAVEATLSNGLTVLVIEDSRLPGVSVSFNVSGAGGIYEPAEQRGLASLTASMLREGTRTRTSRQISEDVDRLGATLNAFSSFTSASAGVNASGLSDNFDDWFALAVDILLNPTFPEEEWNRLKQRTKINLRQQRAQPGFLLNEQFSRVVFGSHPAAVTSHSEKVLDAITPQMLAAWHRERFTPQNTILGIAGDVRAKELLPKLEKWLGGWKKSELKEVMPPDPKPAAAKKIYLVDRPDSKQTNVQMGNIAIDRRSPDYIPLVVANRVLGGGPAGRLFLNLREEKGYTYGAYSNFTALKYPGPWVASGDVRTEVTDGAMTEFLKEIRRLLDEKVPAEELDEARRSVVAGFALSLEQPATLLNYEITRKIYGFPADYWDTYPAKISAVTAEDVQRVARQYLDPEKIQIVAVGDASQVRAVLEKYGPVEVYDTEGRPVAAKAAASGAK
jgi:zinc protease